MEIEFTEDDLGEAIQIASEMYSELVMKNHLLYSGKTNIGQTKEQLEDLMYRCGKVLLKLNRSAHKQGLCACVNDDNHIKMEQEFYNTFKKQIQTEEWWTEQVLERHQSLLSSPPSPISDRKSAEDAPTLLLEPGTPPKFSEGQ